MFVCGCHCVTDNVVIGVLAVSGLLLQLLVLVLRVLATRLCVGWLGVRWCLWMVGLW